jgi:thiamine biosynthesis lipoprotein ApbE
MRQCSRTLTGDEAVVSQPAARVRSGFVDLGLSLSVYGKHEDGSLFEIGDDASPLARQSAAGTWPTEQ